MAGRWILLSWMGSFGQGSAEMASGKLSLEETVVLQALLRAKTTSLNKV